MIAQRLEFASVDQLQPTLDQCDKTSRILAGLLRAIEPG
jgi:hypothetical protein